MLLTFTQWYRWQDMLSMAALVVESRTGTDEAALHAAAAALEQAGGRVLFAEAESYPLRIQRHPQRKAPAGKVAGGPAAGGAGGYPPKTGFTAACRAASPLAAAAGEGTPPYALS